MTNPFRARQAVDTCNVCLEQKRLTKDHVPPSGAIGGRRPMTVWRPMDAERVQRDPRVPLHFESATGMYFTTVCGDCHKDFSDWDESLKTLVRRAKTGIPLVRSMASCLTVRVPTDHIVLSIMAHMLTSRFDAGNSVFESIMRDIVRGRDPADPYRLQFYMWPYDERLPTVSIMHDFVGPVPVSGKLRCGSVIKFGPLVFFVCDGTIRGLTGVDILDTVANPSDVAHVNVHPFIDPTWPESAPWKLGGRNMVEHVAGVQG